MIPAHAEAGKNIKNAVVDNTGKIIKTLYKTI